MRKKVLFCALAFTERPAQNKSAIKSLAGLKRTTGAKGGRGVRGHFHKAKEEEEEEGNAKCLEKRGGRENPGGRKRERGRGREFNKE